MPSPPPSPPPPPPSQKGDLHEKHKSRGPKHPHPTGTYLWVQVVLVIGLAVAVLLGYLSLTRHVKIHIEFMLLTLALFGGGGGILYAIRDGDLESIRFVRRTSGSDVWYAIRLGWLADAMYGVAGAAIIFLILPSMSEQAERRFEAICRKPHEGATDQKGEGPHPDDVKKRADERGAGDNRNDLGFLEVIGLALIGGFGGRLVLMQASDQMLRKRVARVGDQTQANRADLDALAVVVRHLNPCLNDPGRPALEEALRKMSRSCCVRAIDEALHRAQADPDAVTRPALDVLEALDAIDRSLLDNRTLLAMADMQERLHMPEAARTRARANSQTT